MFVDRPSSDSVEIPERFERVVVDVGEAPSRAASAQGRQRFRDMMSMGRAVARSGLDLIYFPATYSFFPVWNAGKLVVTMHDTLPLSHPELIFPRLSGRIAWRLKESVAAHWADRIVTVSQSSRRSIEDWLGRADPRIRVITEGPDPIFGPRADDGVTEATLRRHGLHSGERFLLYVGGLSPHKNLLRLVAAFARSAEADVRLVLTGDVNDVFHTHVPEIRAAIERDQLGQRVLLTGFVPDDDLVHLYNRAYALVQPSLLEGFGLPAIEAMACGTPVIASRAGSLPEVIGAAGCFFDPTDIDSIAQAIRGLLAEPGRRDELARCALERSTHFTWDAAAPPCSTVSLSWSQDLTASPTSTEPLELAPSVVPQGRERYPHEGYPDDPRRSTPPSRDAATMKPHLNLRARLVAAALAAFCVGTGFGIVPRAQAQEKSRRPTLGKIERLDPRLDRLVPRDARVERIAEGFDWSEGPVWDWRNKRLLFSDVPRNTVFQWQDGKGVSVFLKPSGATGSSSQDGEQGSNGLLMDRQGRLVLCQHGDRRVARWESGQKFTTLADKYMGKRLNSPNDAVFKWNGDLYFTDPPYGLKGLNASPAKELAFSGVYRLSAADGTLTLLTKELTFPNGIAFSPDEKTLYVANSDLSRAIWMAFPVKDDGTLGRGKVFADVTRSVPSKRGVPDGMKVDASGNLFATGPGGILVFAPDGTHLGTFATGQATANCAWGEDGSVLYITADMYLGRVQLTTKGIGF